MRDVRPAAVAGLFYPGSPSELAATVRGCLSEALRPAGAPAGVPKALIVPHAGYVYSGPIAAGAYARLAALRGTIRRVVLLGPTHRVAVRGLALPSVRAFATPLGEVEVDREAVAAVAGMPQVVVSDAAHALEHSLEVQLPFLQVVLDEFDILPVAIGLSPPEQVARALDGAWNGADTLIVVSSDLSHYHTSDEARLLDTETTHAILERRSDLPDEQACGARAINGLMQVARRRDLVVELLDQRNSGDTAGDRSRVVGYGSYALYEA